LHIQKYSMKISHDPAKREAILLHRELDFEDAPTVFAGLVFEFVDDRVDYSEVRVVTIGLLKDRMVVIVWTHREGGRHIISMRKANEREQRRYQEQLG
jgi:uncharacterized protein